MAKRTSSKASRNSHPGLRGQPPTAAASRSGNPVLEWLLACGAGQRAAATCALLALLVALAFLPVLRNSFVNYDDPIYVTANPHVLSGLTLPGVKWAFTTLHFGNWHPLNWLSHMLDVQLFGLWAGGHHATNLLYHLASTLVLFLTLRRMTGAPRRSTVVAALFALHPLHVESVAWVSERKDVLSGFFWMLSLWAYVRYAGFQSLKSKVQSLKSKAEAGGPWSVVRGRWPLFHPPSSFFYTLALVCFVCGLMSKPMVVTLPFVLLLLDYWPLQRFRLSTLKPRPSTRWRLVWEKAPFFVLAAVFSGVTYHAQKTLGLVAYEGQPPVPLRIANALLAYVRYLRKTLRPCDLAVFYPYPQAIPAWQVAGAAVLLLGITVWVLRLKGKPWLAVGWFWYLGTLVPVIGLIQIGSHSMADRYTYIPLIGLVILATWGACDLTRRWRYQVPALAVTGAAVSILCLALTRQQLGYWQDSETLFRHALAVTENNRHARKNLGAALLQKGQTDGAIRQFQEALRLKPDDHEAHNNLASALLRKGQVDEAIRQLQEALRLKPESAEALNNLANALDAKGHTDQAIRLHQQALRLKPADAEAHYALGVTLDEKSQTGEAIRQYEEALHLRPDYPEAHNDLGAALAGQGQADAAVRHFQEALHLKPDYAEAHYNLGTALGQKGQMDEAIRQFQTALRLKPGYAEAHNNLGMALSQQGRTAEAIGQFQEALRLKPDYADARRNLDLALALQAPSPPLPITSTNR